MLQRVGSAVGAGLGRGFGLALRASAAPAVLGARWLAHRRGEAGGDEAEGRWSVGLASQVLLDDLFFLSELTSASIVSPSSRHRLRREIDDAVELYSSRGSLIVPSSGIVTL